MRSGIITTRTIQLNPVADPNTIGATEGAIAYTTNQEIVIKEGNRNFVRATDGDLPPVRRNSNRYWYNHDGFGSFNRTTQALTANSLRFFPFFLTDYITFDEVRINVSTAGAGSVAIGIYSNLAGDTYPHNRILQILDINTGTVGTKLATVTQQTLTKGLYWLCYHTGGTATLVSVPIGAIPPVLGYPNSFAANSAIVGVSQTATYVAGDNLPNPAPVSSTVLANVPAPMILLNSL